MNTPIKDLLFRMADDQLILGHRNSEWTGFGPLLEEDIAFSSMAQDKIGHSYALYQLLHQMDEAEPDQLAFMRSPAEFRNCILVELPNGEYDFSLIRHFLYDTAEFLRFEMLASSSFGPLAELARKIKGELRYHTLHANLWVKRLGTATEESISRLQASLEYALPYAHGMFEPSPFEDQLMAEGIFPGESALTERWIEKVEEVLEKTSLVLPDLASSPQIAGTRYGGHTKHLEKLLNEMGEVFRIDPDSEW